MKSLKPLQQKADERAVAEPETGLLGLIRFANLVPANVDLPQFPDLQCLLAADNLNAAVYEREFARFLDESFPREGFGEFRQFLDLGVDHPYRPVEMYEFMVETREALRMIATHQQTRSMFSLGPSFPWAQVSKWKIHRIRVCDNCRKLFFANRNNKLTCSDPCSGSRRVREWRNHRLQYEQARKLKPVRAAADIRTSENEPSARKQNLQGGKNVTQKAR